MRRFRKNVTHSSIRWPAPGLVIAILAGVLSTTGTGRALAQIEQAKLTASDAEESDYFGVSVSVSGNLAVIGAYLDDDGGNYSGSAYVYRYDPPSGGWIEEAKLTASDAAEDDRFGFSVSVSGDLAVIGAYWDDDVGSAYAYRYDPLSGDWIEEAKLTASDAPAWGGFGASVSVSGDLAVIGAPYDADAGTNSGSAYAYRYDPLSGDWIEEAKLTASDAAAWNEFGGSVSVSGDLIVIGAPRQGGWTGSAYVYRYDPPSENWIEEAKLTASDAARGDWFGYSVSVSGDLAVIGAWADDDACPGDPRCESGSAYVYRYDPRSGDWIEEAKLTAYDAEERDQFGESVSVSGDPVRGGGSVAVIGAPHDQDAGWASGSAYVYRYDPPSGDWIKEAKLTAYDAAEDDRFGISVSVSAELAVIGAPYDNDAGTNSGSAYVFDLCPTPAGDLDGDGDVDRDDFALFLDCVTGPGGGPLPPECDPADFDTDGDVDLIDWGTFQAVFTGSH